MRGGRSLERGPRRQGGPGRGRPGRPADNIHVPVGFPQLLRTEFDWDYSTAPERFADMQRIYLPRGKVLGGSSSINAMVYIRGNRADYDGWAEAGCAGWGYDDLTFRPCWEHMTSELTIIEV